MRKTFLTTIILLGALFIFSSMVSAQAATSTSYEVDTSVISSLGDYATSSSYSVEAAIVYYGTEVGTSSSYDFRAGLISTLEVAAVEEDAEDNEVDETPNASVGPGGSPLSPYYPSSTASSGWWETGLLPGGEELGDIGLGNVDNQYGSITGGQGGGISQATPEEILNPPTFNIGGGGEDKGVGVDGESLEGSGSSEEKTSYLLIYTIVIIFIILFWLMKRRR